MTKSDDSNNLQFTEQPVIANQQSFIQLKMSQSAPPANLLPIPSFIVKLQQIMQSGLYSHIIRWDKSGNNLCIVCVQSLEQQVLPKYFRHSKFASFVRQLNMYGFHKKKADKNMITTFYHQHFSRSHINFSAIVKRGKKLSKDQLNKDNISHASKQIQSEHTLHQCQAQLEPDTEKQSSNFKPKKQDTLEVEEINQDSKKTQICELIRELTQRAEPLMEQIQNLGYLDLQMLLKQSKYKGVNYAIFGLMDTDMMNPLANLSFSFKSSDEMELIL